ncbi:MAG TPA: FG-GAP-like repeat-containing protein, partial [Planctomycetota bacterium]|nr:FG-GAP-like repeat-containing protein [Planctomycetota bacterium]
VLYETHPAAPGATRHDLVLLRGDGAGGFHAPLITPQAGGLLNNGATLRAVDVDGDAIPELLRAGFDGPALGGNSEGYAAHLFAYAPGVGHPGPALAVLPRVASVLVFDADGDGDRDVLAGTTTPFSANATYYANGSGALVSHDAAPAMSFTGFPVQWGDLDGDGDTDVFRRNPFFPSTSLFVATNDGGARFTTVADQTSSFYFGQPFVVDWNFDGRDDLLLLQTGAADAWAPSIDGPLGPNFGPPIPIPFDLPQANWTDRVDLDSDGDLDLVLRFAVNQAPVALFDLGGTWSSPTPLGAAPAAGDVSVAYGDFDGDADLDFVKRPATSPMTLGLRQPNGTYAESALPAAVSGSVVAAGDFDGDGDADLLAGKTLWFSTPGGFVAEPVAPFVATTAFFTVGFGVADLDDDGDLDAYADGGFCRWNGAGFGPFEEIPQSPHVGDVNFGLVTRAPWKPIDLDRDGDLDALDFNGGAFLNATRQIYAGRRARPGGTASVVLRGTPNQVVFLYGSALRLDPPAPLPPWGHVFIDVFTAVGVFGAVCDADGRAEAFGFLANDPALLGLELHWQAALPDQAAVTGVATTRVLSL